MSTSGSEHTGATSPGRCDLRDLSRWTEGWVFVRYSSSKVCMDSGSRFKARRCLLLLWRQGSIASAFTSEHPSHSTRLSWPSHLLWRLPVDDLVLGVELGMLHRLTAPRFACFATTCQRTTTTTTTTITRLWTAYKQHGTYVEWPEVACRILAVCTLDKSTCM